MKGFRRAWRWRKRSGRGKPTVISATVLKRWIIFCFNVSWLNLFGLVWKKSWAGTKYHKIYFICLIIGFLWGALSTIWNSLLSWLWPGLYGWLKIRSDYNSSSRDLQFQSYSNLPPLCSDGRCSCEKLIKGSWGPKLVCYASGRRLLKIRELKRRATSGASLLLPCFPRLRPVALLFLAVT